MIYVRHTNWAVLCILKKRYNKHFPKREEIERVIDIGTSISFPQIKRFNNTIYAELIL